MCAEVGRRRLDGPRGRALVDLGTAHRKVQWREGHRRAARLPRGAAPPRRCSTVGNPSIGRDKSGARGLSRGPGGRKHGSPTLTSAKTARKRSTSSAVYSSAQPARRELAHPPDSRGGERPHLRLGANHDAVNRHGRAGAAPPVTVAADSEPLSEPPASRSEASTAPTPAADPGECGKSVVAAAPRHTRVCERV